MNDNLICLACIVGNEESVIERFIRSFAPAVERMVFVRATGTEPWDGCEEIIGRICRELNLRFSVLEYTNQEQWPHVDDFAAARNAAWNGAGFDSKYLLWADADDLLSEGSAQLLRDAAESGRADVFIVPYEVRGKSQIIYRERMVRNDGCSFWRFPVHELLGFKRDVSYHMLKDAAVIHSPLPNKQSSEGRNKRILEHSTEDGARHLFFLSQEAFERGQVSTFQMYAKAALTYPGLDVTENYELLLNLAQHESNCEKARSYAAKAFAMMPDRREALALLACYALLDGKNDEAFHLAKLMASIPMPRKAYWTLNRDWYTWKGFYLLTQTMRAIGKNAEADKLEKEQFEQYGATFSICHPTYLRPEQALAVRDIYLSKATNPMAVEYIFGIHHDDEKSLKLLSGYRHTITDKEGCCPNTLEPLRASTGKFIMIIADDLFPPEGWDQKILQALISTEQDRNLDIGDGYYEEWTEMKIVLNFNDSLRSDGHLCHGFMTRPWLDQYLKDPWPGTGIYSDNEFTHRARKAGVIVDTPQIVFDHRHFTANKSAMDATYTDQNKQSNYDAGLKLLLERNPDLMESENA